MDIKKTVKAAIALLSPILLFPVLIAPYQWFNRNVLIGWLGCGHNITIIDGKYHRSFFTANDFTACFCLLMIATINALSFFLAKHFLKDKPKLRVVYVVCVASLSIVFARSFFRSMLWD